MPGTLIERAPRDVVPIASVEAKTLSERLQSEAAATAAWARRTGFSARPGEICLVPGPDGTLARVLVGASDEAVWGHAALAAGLPAGAYRLEDRLDRRSATAAALGWALGGYRFRRYRGKAGDGAGARLVWPRGADRAAVERAAEATFLVRDLVNTPAADMGPAELAAAARRLARRHGARVSVIVGRDLLRRGYPLIHAVGRASPRAPRLVDLRWGAAGRPRVTLVGKGVCFDSGGLDLKSASGMKLMKKDMGGAANALGLAAMIMAAELPVRLRVLIPAVENSVSGAAMRPGDVLRSRKGLTVEVGNTDAEGRLVLADALAEADREKPALLVDLATLTGAARVALGPEVPAFFSGDDALAEALARHAGTTDDPLWRLPLWDPYRRSLESRIADLNNVAEGGYAGAITAALFLRSFVDGRTPWIHVDMMAWNTRGRPGRPEGGEAQSIRALFALIEERFGPAAAGRAKPARGAA